MKKFLSRLNNTQIMEILEVLFFGCIMLVHRNMHSKAVTVIVAIAMIIIMITFIIVQLQTKYQSHRFAKRLICIISFIVANTVWLVGKVFYTETTEVNLVLLAAVTVLLIPAFVVSDMK